MRLFHHSGWWRLGLGILLILSPALVLGASETSPASQYEALRLFTDALNEISLKSVSPKTEGEMFQGALRGMMNSLDPDSSFLTAQEFADYQKGARAAVAEAGLELVFKEHTLTVVSVLEGGAADRAGLKPGDHILKIDGQLVRNITTQEGVRYFQGPAGKTLKLQVLRNGLVKPLDLNVTLAVQGPPQITQKVLKDGYAYVRLPYFSDALPGELSQVLTQLTKGSPPLKGLILDLRNNARGNLEQAVRTASLFLGSQKVVATRGREGGSEQSYQGSEREQVLKAPLPMVVLVDQGTARAAEILAAALRHYQRGLLLGAKTFGLCGLTRVVPLQDGTALLMTVAYCYTPGDRKISGTGLEPDVEGKKPPESAKPVTSPVMAPDKDPWVLQAIEVLKSSKPGRMVRKAQIP